MEGQSSIPTPTLQRTCLNTHITALKTLYNFLFVAEGNQALIYDWTQKILLHREIIFNSCSIHGIRIGVNNKVLFFGAKSIKIISINLSLEKCFVQDVTVFNLDDWIQDVQWIKTEEKVQETIAVVTAHNCLTLWSVSGQIIQSFQCLENCILYSASIIISEPDVIILAVGTVFRKILLWSPNSTKEDKGRKIPFHQLAGHQGVIFSVTFSSHHSIMCSTSDDRSLRIWKVHNNDEDDKKSLRFWESSTINIMHVLFSHESRVWRSAILEDYILSIGEDSFICIWGLNGKLLKRLKGHKGGSIWCLETGQISSTNESILTKKETNITAFTGGSDGGVYMWDLSNAFCAESISQVALHQKDHVSTGDFPRISALLTGSIVENFIVSTDKGWISLFNMQLQTWKDIFYDIAFASYCILSVLNDSACIALANIFGDLVLINSKEQSLDQYDFKKFRIHDTKICSLHWANKSSLLSCGTEGQMVLWNVIHETEFKIQCLHKFYLPKCKNHWWTTAALFLSSKNILVVGDRGGTVSVYSHTTDNEISDAWDHPITTYRGIHKDNGVTDLQEYNSFVYSTGRDGKVNQYIINDGTLKLLHTIKVSHDLEWIGKILFYRSHLLLIGFHTKDFVVWSTELESAVMTVECGGGHRSYDFYLTEKGIATFVAIKKKNIIYCKQDLHHILNESTLKAGISGQQFSCLTYLFTEPYKDKGSISVAACGGEDNAVRIIGFIDVPDKLSNIISISSLSGHLSSIRAIGKAKMLASNAWILASVGGRSQIMIWRLEYSNNGVNSEQMLSCLLSTFEKKAKNHCKESQCIQVDPQTRLMDVFISPSSASQPGAEIFVIGVACSDSYFRLYRFDVDLKKLSFDHIFKHDENCILKLTNFELSSCLHQKFYVTGATNGSLKILNYKDNSLSSIYLPSKHLEEFQHLHQSGINALDSKFIIGNIWMICSGGDDNSLKVVHVSFDLEVSDSIKIISQCNQVNAHASQITGVKILDESTIVSASIDQRINVWKINNSQSSCISLLTSAVSLIPDIAHLEGWQNKNSSNWTLAVCGQGIETFKLRIEENRMNNELLKLF